MNLILYRWNICADQLLHDHLKAMGHQVTDFKEKLADYNADLSFSQKLLEKMIQTNCEAVFSYNYFPVIAEICHVRHIPYISWVYDCPHLTLFSKTVFYQTNYIFAFDREMCRDMEQSGVEHIYHVSLATDSAFWKQQIAKQTEAEKKKYRSDISFVGGLYIGKYNFFDQITYLPEYIRGYLDAVIRAQQMIYGYNFVKDMLTEQVVRELKNYVKFDFGEQYFVAYEEVLASMINKKVTVLERESVLQRLSAVYPVDLYTGSDTAHLQNVKNRGYVDYESQMPKVFYNSRINLNVTLKSITSGIPQRALDIMGCGGFLLSNYQPELAESFEDGKELVFYSDMADMENKVAYYLSHEEERAEIAQNGFRKVQEFYSYETKLSEILRTVKIK